MPQQLFGGAAIVDVSNVCWSAELPPSAPDGRLRPALDRLDLLVTAWRSLHGGDARLQFVADTSLPHYLPASDAARWPELVREHAVRMAPVADERILQVAAEEEIAVLSRDHFIDHRDEHPWIGESPGRFISWRYSRGLVSFQGPCVFG